MTSGHGGHNDLDDLTGGVGGGQQIALPRHLNGSGEPDIYSNVCRHAGCCEHMEKVTPLTLTAPRRINTLAVWTSDEPPLSHQQTTAHWSQV